MLLDHVARMIRPTAKTGQKAGMAVGIIRAQRSQGITHRHRHIAQPAFMTDAADRAAFGHLQKLSLGPVEERDELLAGQAGAFVKVGQGAALGEFVPRADQLAVVAAVDAVADQRPQLERNRPGMLDGEVGDAATRIQPVRRDDGPRRADVDAGGATAAMRRDRLARLQGQVDINFAEKEHRPGFAVKQQCVLAAPALPASSGQFCLQHWSRVGEHAMTERFHLPGNFFTQRLQARPQDLVIVAAPRIDRHDAFGGPLQPTELDGLPGIAFGRGYRQIIHARGDDADRARNQLSRARPLESVRGHVMHVTMKPGRQPGRQSRFGRRQINACHANLRESKLTRPCLNLKNQLMTVDDHAPIVKNIVWTDEAATCAFAQTLARRPALGDALIELKGDLGAGKTTFVRHLLGAMGVAGRIKSPTYTVVEAYTLEPTAATASGLNIWHFDFFRFNDPREWEDAGFRDIFASPGLKLVEWPEKAGDYLPPPDLLIAIDLLADESRTVTLTARTATGRALLA